MMRRITRKTTSLRRAVAHARVRASAATIDRVRSNETSKRDVLAVARVAAISAAKKTSDLIPYCHPVPVESVDVSFELEGDVIDIAVQVEAVARTGLEMEALTAASVAALTIYDMLKPDDRHMVIENVHLEFKQGGRSDPANARVPDGFTVEVVVASDGVSRGERQDHSGAAIVERLHAWGIEASLCVVPDDREVIVRTLRERVERRTDLVITTGGTGLGPRDVTVDATR
ncbi:MAG TPA: cyclic pyranopterin monophosphate synthase MoaC, partial [Candidatus Krumholzibacteria bacterium]|nr:cyclic pyranopterin monophosphate synthase MoaC [Candidatus Krumholzibacteria bacterium]